MVIIDSFQLNITSFNTPMCTKSPVMDYITFLHSIFVPISFTIIMIIGFFGNLLVIVVILANIHMRNTTNILIISLTIADLLFIIFCVPFTAVMYVTGGWPLGRIFCQIYQYMTHITPYCSVYTLVLMSIDRYLAVVHPIRSMTLRNSRNTIISVVIVWGLFLITNLPLLINSGVIKGDRDEVSNCWVVYCSYKPLLTWNSTSHRYQENNYFGKIYFTMFFVMFYLLPIIVISVLYGFLINRLLCGRTSKLSHSSEATLSKRRVTKMVIVVIVVFALCWGPIQCIFIIQLYFGDPGGNLFRTVHVISNCLAYANSMINPFLYTFLSENFRRGFANLFCCKRVKDFVINFTATNPKARRLVTNDCGTNWMVNSNVIRKQQESTTHQQKMSLINCQQDVKINDDNGIRNNNNNAEVNLNKTILLDNYSIKSETDEEKSGKFETLVLLETRNID